MDDIEIIKENILKEASINNLGVTENIDKIAKAKLRFFGVDEWHRCPCYSKEDTEHGCGKPACLETIKQDGICHCRLFTKKD